MANETTDSFLLTVDDASRYLNCKRSWLYANAERLPTLRLGKQIRFRQSDLDEWLEGNRANV